LALGVAIFDGQLSRLESCAPKAANCLLADDSAFDARLASE
jgi:hypothetical protein